MSTIKFFSAIAVVFLIGGVALAKHVIPRQCHSSLQVCNTLKGIGPRSRCPLGEQCVYNGEESFCADQSYKAPLMGRGSSYRAASQQCKDDMNRVIDKCQALCPSGHGVYDKCYYSNDIGKKYADVIADRIVKQCPKRPLRPPLRPPLSRRSADRRAGGNNGRSESFAPIPQEQQEQNSNPCNGIISS